MRNDQLKIPAMLGEQWETDQRVMERFSEYYYFSETE